MQFIVFKQFFGDDASKDMKTHLVNKCEKPVTIHQCEECGKPFQNIASLKKHTKLRRDTNVTNVLK